MQISDVIADMLTRIRNANNAKHETVDVPASNLKKSIAKRATSRLSSSLRTASRASSVLPLSMPQASRR